MFWGSPCWKDCISPSIPSMSTPKYPPPNMNPSPENREDTEAADWKSVQVSGLLDWAAPPVLGLMGSFLILPGFPSMGAACQQTHWRKFFNSWGMLSHLILFPPSKRQAAVLYVAEFLQTGISLKRLCAAGEVLAADTPPGICPLPLFHSSLSRLFMFYCQVHLM